MTNPSSTQNNVIELMDATKIYSIGERNVYGARDVDLKVKQGETIVIFGPSGCGKTTLLNLIGGIDTPTNGTVVVGGKDLSSLSDKALTKFRKRHVGFIFQFFNLIQTLTASENVELALHLRGIKGPQARTKATKYLQKVGLRELKDRFPSELSGGERQRVAIARAMAKEPMILLADEPTGNLGSESGRQVLASLYQATEELGRTLIVATHDVAIKKLAERIVRLENGQITEEKINENPKLPSKAVR